MKHFLHIVILVSLSTLLLCGCDRSVMFTDDQRVDEKGWNLKDKLYFDVDVTDTMKLYTFFVNLRVDNQYPYSNAFFFINTTFPDGGVAADTLECPLADVDGRWYGKQTGRYIDNRYVFRKNMIFPAKGRYRFEIGHAMRDTNVVGIKNVGLRIEYSSK